MLYCFFVSKNFIVFVVVVPVEKLRSIFNIYFQCDIYFVKVINLNKRVKTFF